MTARNLSIASVIDKNLVASDRAWLIALRIHVRNPVTGVVDEVIRVVNNTEDITIGAEEFVAFAFELQADIAENEMPKVSVTIHDMSGLVLERADNYNGGVGFRIDMLIIQPPDGATYVEEPDLTEVFTVTGASAQGFALSWTLGAEEFLAIPFPRRKQYRDRCSFRYKSVECGYAGALPTCDLTLGGPNGCRVHDNAVNFGGCPGILKRL